MIKLETLEGLYSICRLHPQSSIPLWFLESNDFKSITFTDKEVSVIVKDGVARDFLEQETGYRVFRISGTLDFSLTGILSSLLNPLAAAGIPVFTLSTYDTDYLLIKKVFYPDAKKILRENGFI